MKAKIVLENGEKSVIVDIITSKVKEKWLERGHKIKEMQNVAIYLKPEENMAYCVVNETEKINIPF